MRNQKPLGRKNYGSIPHLPNSRMGPSDHACHIGQERIATIKTRDKHDEIIVQEKLDGSNVGVARLENTIFPLGRAGYLASSSPYLQHRYFSNWVYANIEKFLDVLNHGERLVGEWLMQAHGTRYELSHEPFVAFDLMIDDKRLPFDQFKARIDHVFITPHMIHKGLPITVKETMERLGKYGFHGALDPVEGAVWRIERNKLIDRHSGIRERVVDFLVKWVRPDKVDGKYLENISGEDPIWNVNPEDYLLKKMAQEP